MNGKLCLFKINLELTEYILGTSKGHMSAKEQKRMQIKTNHSKKRMNVFSQQDWKWLPYLVSKYICDKN